MGLYLWDWLVHPYRISGKRAERCFQDIATAQGYMLERISQTREDFGQYRRQALCRVKRGDFYIRKLRLEVEVKCKRRYRQLFYLEYAEYKAHTAMVRLTGDPLIFAFFERAHRDVIPTSLHMIPLQKIVDRDQGRIAYDPGTKCLLIPVASMWPRLTYLEQLRRHRG